MVNSNSICFDCQIKHDLAFSEFDIVTLADNDEKEDVLIQQTISFKGTPAWLPHDDDATVLLECGVSERQVVAHKHMSMVTERK